MKTESIKNKIRKGKQNKNTHMYIYFSQTRKRV